MPVIERHVSIEGARTLAGAVFAMAVRDYADAIVTVRLTPPYAEEHIEALDTMDECEEYFHTCYSAPDKYRAIIDYCYAEAAKEIEKQKAAAAKKGKKN